MTRFTAWLLAACLTGPVLAEKPVIDHQPVVCSLPGKHPRLCAAMADDGTIKKARVFFRAAGQQAYYWSEMTWDGLRFCATLPVPAEPVRTVEYYLWAIDDEFLNERTITLEMTVDPERSCEHPVIDDDAERTSSLVVHATAKKQGKKLRLFAARGVRFVAVRP